MENKRRKGRPRPMGNVKAGFPAKPTYVFKQGGKLKTNGSKTKK